MTSVSPDSITSGSGVGARAGGLRRFLPPGLAGRSRRAAWRRARLRRLLAAVLAGTVVWAVADRLLPEPPVPGVPVLVAARDLPAGRLLGSADLAIARWPPSVRPTSAISEAAAALGRQLNGPTSAGEAVTADRLLGPGLLTGSPPGTVAAHLLLSDPGAVAMVRTGDSVDVLSGTDGSLLAEGVRVLAVDDTGSGGLLAGVPADSGSQSPGLVVALSTTQASAVARAAGRSEPGSGLVVTVRSVPG